MLVHLSLKTDSNIRHSENFRPVGTIFYSEMLYNYIRAPGGAGESLQLIDLNKRHIKFETVSDRVFNPTVLNYHFSIESFSFIDSIHIHSIAAHDFRQLWRIYLHCIEELTKATECDGNMDLWSVFMHGLSMYLFSAGGPIETLIHSSGQI